MKKIRYIAFEGTFSKEGWEQLQEWWEIHHAEFLKRYDAISHTASVNAEL